ncbi:LolA family protein [Neorickettsia risticii]|uniref:Outer membrane lipoprotein carrier protein LolA n=1 Tax=Neorickettsia risticii (strain Illinois) TaxID=434131 RepID=C6V5J4_NEORI|nr:outer membrane lipoprotein carrier protein LolA [Neorickettsia risticii]ACT69669.1 outer membrane lipoprotein carrier protein LolA [Neorickettsia risticii str. Illinois]
MSVKRFAVLFCVLAFCCVRASCALDNAELVSYLASLRTLCATFVQYNPDGTLSTGSLFLSVPHKFRVDYHEEGVSVAMNKGMITYRDATLKESRSFFVGKSDPLLLAISDLGALHRYKQSIRGGLFYLERSSKNRKYVLVLSHSPAEIREILFEDDSKQITRMILSDVCYNASLDRSIFDIIK